MNKKGPILGAAAPIDKGQPRMYAPRKYAAWMIGVLAVFAACSVFFVVNLGWSGAWIMLVTGLIFAALFAAWRRSRTYGGVHWCIYVFLIMALLAMIFPVFHNFREAALWMSCMDNLKQLGLGLQNYEHARKKFPPAFIADKEGKPAYSWRAMIFPYIESGGVYKRFNFDKPWDSPEQKKFLGDLSYAYSFQCPSCSRRPDRPDWRADYVAVLGEDTFWRSDGKPREAKEITKDLGDTPVLIEIEDSDILWYKPRDVTLDDFLSGKLSWSESA
ncbi:MAG: DUF1559 domain-containing protein, partial [Planctomycetia bacterium]